MPAALQKQGLNYFLLDLTKNARAALTSFLTLRCFAGKTSTNSSRVRWQQDDIYLLTWPGPDTQPLPETFLTKYTTNGREGVHNLRPLYDQIRTIYEMNRTRSYPIYRDPALPPVKGWQ